MTTLSRRLRKIWGALALAPMLAAVSRAAPPERPLMTNDIPSAARIAGLEFSEAQQVQMLDNLNEHLAALADLRSRSLPDRVGSALVFDPRPPGFRMPAPGAGFHWEPPVQVLRPATPEDLAFASVAELAALLRSQRITSTELTELCLDRLRRFGPALRCVVTLTADRALASARAADQELRVGRWRGPLHGIPYGAKDLLDVAGTPSTWGVTWRTNATATGTAAVIGRLDAAGAVLVAKLSLGELAMGDVWFGGLTRNPWRPDSGSSGSSAGSAAAVAAGLVPFAVGSETLGSIVSPSTVCGVTGLRPTFGRVSRDGAMTLCFSLDKLGPLARSAEDCALVFEVMRGPGGADRSVIAAPFDYPGPRPQSLRVGYLQADFGKDYPNRTNDARSLDLLRQAGLDLKPVMLPRHPKGIFYALLNAEAAASFDELTRSHRDDQLVQQGEGNWPNSFRSARFISAVDYLEANRARLRLMEDLEALFRDIDVLVAPTWSGNQLLFSNMTGHPCVVVPNGSPADGPASFCVLGPLFGEAGALAVAELYQRLTPSPRPRPDLRSLAAP
jgi:Asp-tRNA(Asn)/Glu-tRNA(Gln) amidotransferase A subunit family amidase